jgi:hypothetical protein
MFYIDYVNFESKSGLLGEALLFAGRRTTVQSARPVSYALISLQRARFTQYPTFSKALVLTTIAFVKGVTIAVGEGLL